MPPNAGQPEIDILEGDGCRQVRQIAIFRWSCFGIGSIQRFRDARHRGKPPFDQWRPGCKTLLYDGAKGTIHRGPAEAEDFKTFLNVCMREGRQIGAVRAIAFVAEPVSFAGVTPRPVFEEQLVLVAPKSFPPLDNTREISGKTVIAFEAGCAYRGYLEQWLLDAGIVPGGVMAVSSYLAIFACVSAGTGYAMVPRSVLDVVSTEGNFLRYALPESLSRIKTLLVWRSDYASPKLDALIELLPQPHL